MTKKEMVRKLSRICGDIETAQRQIDNPAIKECLQRAKVEALHALRRAEND